MSICQRLYKILFKQKDNNKLSETTSDVDYEPTISDIKKIFSNYTIDNTSELHLTNIYRYARILDFKELDIVTIVLPIEDTLNPKLYQFHVKIPGILLKSSPEKTIRARNKVLMLLGVTPNVTNEAFTRSEILKKFTDTCVIVWVKCNGFESLGRLNAEIYITPDDKKSISDLLLLDRVTNKSVTSESNYYL